MDSELLIPVQKSLLGNTENIVILLVHLISKKLYLFLKKIKNFNLFNDCFPKRILKIDTTFYKLNVLEGSQYFLNYLEVSFEPESITQNLSIFIFFPITHKKIY